MNFLEKTWETGRDIHREQSESTSMNLKTTNLQAYFFKIEIIHSTCYFLNLKRYVHSDLGTRLSCFCWFFSFTFCPTFFSKLTMGRAGGTTHDLQGRGWGISYIWAMKRGTCVELREKLYKYTNISSYVRIVGRQLQPINTWQGLWFSTRKSWWFHVRVVFKILDPQNWWLDLDIVNLYICTFSLSLSLCLYIYIIWLDWPSFAC